MPRPPLGQDATEHADGGRFAGPVGPQEAEDLATLDAETNVVDRRKRAETPLQVVDRHRRAGRNTGRASAMRRRFALGARRLIDRKRRRSRRGRVFA